MPKSKGCHLIATIPAMTDLDKVEHIISDHFISGVRWNTGVVSPYNEFETLQILKKLTDKYHKKFWVDLKGRQLRITEWAAPMFSCIKVNHNFSVDLPATIILRGEEPLIIEKVAGNKIFTKTIPKNCVGAGQSVNILGENLNIEGYLTDKDKDYLAACNTLGISNIMASFVEDFHDILDILEFNQSFRIVCKIESKKGVEFLAGLKGSGLGVMAARDDLYVELNNGPYTMYDALTDIINTNKNAICASRIFTSLEHSRNVALSDFSDLELMYNIGYRNFMLCDNVCNYCFDKAIKAWRIFLYEKR